MTEERLEEIAAYHTSRKEFDWKDVCGWTYIEHVGTLLAEVRRLRKALADYGQHVNCKAGPAMKYQPWGPCECGLIDVLEASGE